MPDSRSSMTAAESETKRSDGKCTLTARPQPSSSSSPPARRWSAVRAAHCQCWPPNHRDFDATLTSTVVVWCGTHAPRSSYGVDCGNRMVWHARSEVIVWCGLRSSCGVAHTRGLRSSCGVGCGYRMVWAAVIRSFPLLLGGGEGAESQVPAAVCRLG